MFADYHRDSTTSCAIFPWCAPTPRSHQSRQEANRPAPQRRIRVRTRQNSRPKRRICRTHLAQKPENAANEYPALWRTFCRTREKLQTSNSRSAYYLLADGCEDIIGEQPSSLVSFPPAFVNYATAEEASRRIFPSRPLTAFARFQISCASSWISCAERGGFGSLSVVRCFLPVSFSISVSNSSCRMRRMASA
jgi:hypothetical protein